MLSLALFYLKNARGRKNGNLGTTVLELSTASQEEFLEAGAWESFSLMRLSAWTPRCVLRLKWSDAAELQRIQFGD